MRLGPITRFACRGAAFGLLAAMIERGIRIPDPDALDYLIGAAYVYGAALNWQLAEWRR